MNSVINMKRFLHMAKAVTPVQRSRFMYILQAGLEYLVAILVGGSFLATITSYLGLSDGMTAIITSITGMGTAFQLISMVITPKNTKRMVIAMSVINQLLFMTMYVIPLVGGEAKISGAVFVAVVVLAYLIYNIAHPKKVDWFMSMVDEGNRGRFTATKEVISLIMGMVYTFIMGAVVDHYEAIGDLRMGFFVCAVTIFGIMVLHTLTMVFTIEKESDSCAVAKGKISGIKNVIKDRDILKVTVIFIVWNLATSFITPYLGTYQIKELGMSLKFISGITIATTISRVLFSRLWGAYADKNSFAKMLRICIGIAMIAYGMIVFSGPSTVGIVIYIAYMILINAANAGTNSAIINLCYEYSAPDKRADAMAFVQACAGIIPFLNTLLVSRLFAYLQSNPITVFGHTLFAQQVLAACTVVVCIIPVVLLTRMSRKR